MRVQGIAMVVSIALGVLTAGDALGYEMSATSGAATRMRARQCEGKHEGKRTPEKNAKKAKVDPEYMKIQTFSAFRKRVIEDGWVPVPNPDCHDAVKGGDYDDSCRDQPDSIGCRVCAMVPELFRHTTDGYNLMRYTKNGVPLGVTVYGDISDLDAPGRYGLGVVGWEYAEGLNVILIED